jgi:hypothetical protein
MVRRSNWIVKRAGEARFVSSVFAMIVTVMCTTSARSQSLDLQEKCASQARKTFEELQNEDKANQSPLLEPGAVVGDYQSHYNTKLNRCLLLITRWNSYSKPNSVVISSRFLIDANERRYYASHVEQRLVKEATSSMVSCELTPRIFEKVPCKARGDFDAFVAPYMEE